MERVCSVSALRGERRQAGGTIRWSVSLSSERRRARERSSACLAAGNASLIPSRGVRMARLAAFRRNARLVARWSASMARARDAARFEPQTARRSKRERFDVDGVLTGVSRFDAVGTFLCATYGSADRGNGGDPVQRGLILRRGRGALAWTCRCLPWAAWERVSRLSLDWRG